MDGCLLSAGCQAIHPEQLSAWSGCSKSVLKNVQNWTFLRVTKHWPPVEPGDKLGPKASDADLKWAAAPFEWK